VHPHEHSDGKIQGWHRDRLAAVYIRQSSRQQVADHGESTRLQYGLTERAVALGWPASRMMVIDEDLGRSAANAAERPGFARLVAELTMGHVGLVLGLEMPRLARAGRDCARRPESRPGEGRDSGAWNQPPAAAAACLIMASQRSRPSAAARVPRVRPAAWSWRPRPRTPGSVGSPRPPGAATGDGHGRASGSGVRRSAAEEAGLTAAS
jgi:hypothetical protein